MMCCREREKKKDFRKTEGQKLHFVLCKSVCTCDFRKVAKTEQEKEKLCETCFVSDGSFSARQQTTQINLHNYY